MFSVHQTSVAAPEDDLMDIDQVEPQAPHLPFPSAARTMNQFSLLDPSFSRSIFDGRSDFTSRAPIVTHPRELREIPIEVKDNNQPSGQSGHTPTIEDVTGTVHAPGPDIHGTVLIDDEADEDISAASTVQATQLYGQGHIVGEDPLDRNFRPNAPEFDSLPDYGDEIEEEMIRAAIEASKREVEGAHNVCDANLQCLQGCPPCSLSILNACLS